jgi:integrase
VSRAITRHRSGGGNELAPNDDDLRLEQGKRIARRAAAVVEQGTPPNTRRAYESDQADFEAWCEQQDPPFPALPTTELALIGYLTDMSEGKWPPARRSPIRSGTIERRLSGIAWTHAAENHLSPRTPRISKFLHSIKVGRSRGGEAPAQMAAPIGADDLRKIVAWLDTLASEAAVRDKALLLVGWSCAMRRSEICGLQFEDLGRVSVEGVTVRIARSKTDQEGTGVVLPIAREPDKTVCPVEALEAWLELRGSQDGPLFCGSWRGKLQRQRRVTDTQVRRLVATGVKMAKLVSEFKGMNFSAHSLRAGFITEAIRAGHRESTVKDRSRHKTYDVFLRYVRIAQTFENNPQRGILSKGDGVSKP